MKKHISNKSFFEIRQKAEDFLQKIKVLATDGVDIKIDPNQVVPPISRTTTFTFYVHKYVNIMY